jgi:hypothetical protein
MHGEELLAGRKVRCAETGDGRGRLLGGLDQEQNGKNLR